MKSIELILLIASSWAITTVVGKSNLYTGWTMKFADNTPYQDQTAEVGDTITFIWTDDEVQNVFIHPTNDCNQTGRIPVGNQSPTTYIFTADDASPEGKEIYFVCDIGDRCEENGMRMSVTVFPSPDDASLEQTLDPVAINSSPVSLTTAPTEPLVTTAPVAATDAPVEPTIPPVAPTDAPVEPTIPPIAPTNTPIEPTIPPVTPTQTPIAPTILPVAPTKAPIVPTGAPVAPTLSPIEPSEAPVEPTEAPIPTTMPSPYYEPTTKKPSHYFYEPTAMPPSYYKPTIIDKPTIAFPEIAYPEGRGEDPTYVQYHASITHPSIEHGVEFVDGRIDNGGSSNIEDTQTAGQCFSIAEIICNTDGFHLFCEALTMVGLLDLLNSLSSAGQLTTVFAPNDEAFLRLFETSIPGKLNPDTMSDLMAFHLVRDSIMLRSEDLVCNDWLLMVNGEQTFTHCRGFDKYQVGRGNIGGNDGIISLKDSPIILKDNIVACNGIIHTVAKVILPESW